MKQNVIFHNPRCSKSRATLNLLQEKGIEVKVVEYLDQPPSKLQLKFICNSLGVEPKTIVRTKDDLFKQLRLSIKDKRSANEWISILHNNPKLIERPIVVYKGKVAVGRPPENVLKII